LGTRTGFADGHPGLSFADKPKSQLREYAETILICVLVFVFLRGFVFQQSEIPSGSMEDTVLPGDYILVNRLSYAPTSFDWERKLLPLRPIERGDLVVFKHPDEPERDFIKRVIGLPGERVEVRGGFVFIDGERLDEPYINPLYRSRDFFGPRPVPPGEYFLMGDHRCDSADSRAWKTTTVPKRLIKGRAFMILFSTTAPPVDGQPGKVTLKSTLRKLWYIAFRSRWDRALRLIG
jgi:signal peptidase I